jgi:prepilin-type processing-associated H-X9-DG protein
VKPIVELQSGGGKPFFTMSYNDRANYLYCDWSGYLVHQQIVDGCEQMLGWARANAELRKCVATINDNRKLRGSWEPAVDWIDRNVNKQIYDLGIGYDAIVIGQDLFTQVSAEALAATNRPGSVTHRLVPSLQAAEAWIAEMQQGRGRS